MPHPTGAAAVVVKVVLVVLVVVVIVVILDDYRIRFTSLADFSQFSAVSILWIQSCLARFYC